MIDKVKEVENAAQDAWNENSKVGIVSLVEVGGVAVDGAHYPYGTAFEVGKGVGKPPMGCVIEISLNACKSFGYNKETNTFDYDVAVNGKPFYGSIPVWSVLCVMDMNTDRIFGSWEPSSKAVKPVKRATAPKIFKPLVCVWTNPDNGVTVKKSVAKLYLVA